MRLLILGCSKAKSTEEGLLPAIERYDGPAFRVVRRYLRTRRDAALQIVIVSAEFGLVSVDEPIPHYDRRMTPERARELQPQVSSRLAEIMRRCGWKPSAPRDLLVYLGKDYLPALSTTDGLDADLLQDQSAEGSQGRKLSILHDWLYSSPPPSIDRVRGASGLPRFRGMDLELDREGVLEVARRGLRQGRDDLARPRSWAVEVDGHQVAPKWLVSQLTGLPVSRFTTTEARSLLARVGIEVKRV